MSSWYQGGMSGRERKRKTRFPPSLGPIPGTVEWSCYIGGIPLSRASEKKLYMHCTLSNMVPGNILAMSYGKEMFAQ